MDSDKLSEEEERKLNRHEHAKFLLYQVQQELNSSRDSKDLIIQCQDGSYVTSSLLILAVSPNLVSVLSNSDENVLVLPNLLMGELLLFLKYVFTNNVQQMFNKEDVSVIQSVGEIFSHSLHSEKDVIRQYTEVVSSETEIEVSKNLETLTNSSETIVPKEIILQEDEAKDTQCGKVNSNQAIKMRRLEEKKKLSSSVPCCFCHEIINFTLLAKHVKQKHPEKEFICQICQTSCVDRIGLESHIQQHSEGNLYYLICEICCRVCTSQYQLQHHKRSHNTKKLSSYDCKICKKTFLIKPKFEKHMELHQTGKLEETMECKYCEKTFKKTTDLNRHLKSHQGIKSYSCDVCGEKFVDGTRLKHHKWIHLGHKSFKCNQCDKDFRHKSHLQTHIASFHPEAETTKYVCTQCNRKFAFEYKFKQHLKWHKLDLSERIEYESVEYNLIDMNIINQ